MAEDDGVDYSWLASLPARIHRSDSNTSSPNSSPAVSVRSCLSAHTSYASPESQAHGEISKDSPAPSNSEIMHELETNISQLRLISEDYRASDHATSFDTQSEPDNQRQFPLSDHNSHADRNCRDIYAADLSEESQEINSQDIEGQADCGVDVVGSENGRTTFWSDSAEPPLQQNLQADGEKFDYEKSGYDSDSCQNFEDPEKNHTFTEIHGSAMKPSKQSKVQYNAWIKQARDFENSGDFMEALDFYEKALEIFDANEKLRKKISKLRTHLTVKRQSVLQQITIEMDEDQPAQDGWEHDSLNEIYIRVEHRDFFLTNLAYETLLPYQRDGVAWLCDLHVRAQGGILGDDMGLGKTCQTITFINAAFQCRMVKRVLIVAPVSVLNVWSKEFKKFGEQVLSRVMNFHGSNVRERNRNLEYVSDHGGVCLTSYGLCANNAERLSNTKWDYLICDEGHKLKNSSIQLYKRMCLIRARHRLLLTGTPLQNNLLELWALYDFVLPSLLDDQQTFKNNFVRPIVDGNDKEASESERALGAARAKELREKIQPFHLSRTKAEVFGGTENFPTVNSSDALALKTKKTEWIVWLQLSSFQLHVYKEFLDSEQVRNALNTTRSPLAAINVLKKICDHPLLLQKEARHAEQSEEDGNAYMQNILKEWQNSQLTIANDSDSESRSASMFLTASNKLIFLVSLLTRLQEDGHKTLVFSQSVRMLNMIGECLNVAGIRYLQIDGSIVHIEERQRLIDKFNKSSKISCFLLTTGVGGVGITLTGADRVVIYDPSWNPSSDAQAVDRAYRVGQTRDVVVYRLVTCGTVEEKILRNQIFKRGLHRVVLQKEHQQRYFTKQQLHALFDLGPTDFSQTHQELRELHGHQRCESQELERHRNDVERRSELWVRGISDYHLLFSHPPAPPLATEPISLVTPSAKKARSHKSVFSNPRPARKNQTRSVPSSRTAVGKSVLIQNNENQSDDEGVGVRAMDAIEPLEEFSGFCSPLDLARLGDMGRRRLEKLLVAAATAEAELATKCSPTDHMQAGKKALRLYLRAAELLVGVLGECGVAAEHQSKLVRLATAVGLSTSAVRHN